MRASLAEMSGAAELEVVHRVLAAGLDALERATEYLVAAEPALAAAGSSPYLALVGAVRGGWLMARLALAARGRGSAEAKLATACFYASITSPARPPTCRPSWAARRCWVSIPSFLINRDRGRGQERAAGRRGSDLRRYANPRPTAARASSVSR